MSKKRQNNPKNRRERDAPIPQHKAGAMIGGVSPDFFTRWLTDCGYTPLKECPEVRACVHAYADAISSMTIHLMRNTPDGDERVTGDEISRKIDIHPCAGMTRKQWMYNIVYTLLLTGDGNQITLATGGTGSDAIGDLIPVPASLVSFYDRGGGDYDILIQGREIPKDQCIHFVWMPDASNPWVGKGMQVSLRGVVDCLSQASRTKRDLMASPMPSLVVKVDGLSEDFASAEGRAKLRKQYISASDNGEPWFIPSESFALEQIKPLTIADLAIRDNMEIDKRAIAALFRVPPYVVGIGEYDREAHNNFITGAVMSVAQEIQQRLTDALLTENDLYFRFNPRNLMDYSLAELSAVGASMVQINAMRRNEFRDWIGLPPDPEMQELLVLENYIPASKAGQQKKLNS